MKYTGLTGAPTSSNPHPSSMNITRSHAQRTAVRAPCRIRDKPLGCHVKAETPYILPAALGSHSGEGQPKDTSHIKYSLLITVFITAMQLGGD